MPLFWSISGQTRRSDRLPVPVRIGIEQAIGQRCVTYIVQVDHIGMVPSAAQLAANALLEVTSHSICLRPGWFWQFADLMIRKRQPKQIEGLLVFSVRPCQNPMP